MTTTQDTTGLLRKSILIAGSSGVERDALDGNEQFAELAASIDEGWLSFVAQSQTLRAQIDEIGPRSRNDRAELADARALLEATEIDLTRAAEAAIAREDQAKLRQWAFKLEENARRLLVERANSWVDAHQSELCQEIQDRRSVIAAAISERANLLHDVSALEDISSRPDAAAAYAGALPLLEEWQQLSVIHRGVINGASNVWTHLEFIKNYAEVWPMFYLRVPLERTDNRWASPERLDIDGTLLAAIRNGSQPPWDGDSALATIKVIASSEIWTPTASQLKTTSARIDQDATARRFALTRDYAAAAEKARR
ncbi:MAG: hypothetical protein EPO52_05725 [Herbiconiux sp.]|uniref:hypothetical protein n=1 Tax=Herbiconiux sp. TaxID=1871186 RepID=UPI00120F130C|nr:hypothetical protein [Herbiconiux sp.]TAJ48869.1 MAG: hypothetical protein EPO52_05725 [Herbiconiux sp.]